MTATGDELTSLAMAGELPAPGSWRSALYREDAPGAALDGQPWAATWGTFLRAISDKRDTTARQFISNAWSERVPGEGGFLVPEQLRSQVLSYMTAPVVRPKAMVLPMGSLRLDVPNLDNPSQASSAQALGGLTFSVTQPGATIPASTPDFGRTTLEARKIAAYLKDTPNELVRDAAGAFGDFMARVIAEGHAWYEDDLFIANGTGAGEPEALMNAGCAIGVDRASSNAVVLADLVAMFKALHPASKQAGLTSGVTSVAWLLSAAVLDQILELYLIANPSGSAPTVQQFVALSDWFQAGDGDQVGPSLLGLPALITDHQPALGSTGDVMLADLRHYMIGDRLEMVIEQSAGGPGFVTDTSEFRVKSRLDGRYWIQSPTTTEAGETVSPVVVLDTHT